MEEYLLLGSFFHNVSSEKEEIRGSYGECGEAFKLWLHSFVELVYETDSLLSDVGEKAMRHQLIEESYASITSKKKKVLKFISAAIANVDNIFKEFKEFSNQDMLQEGALADKLLGKMMSGTLQTMSRNAFKDALLNCDTLMLNKLPSGIGGMTSLQFLSKVIIEGSNRHKISKLKGMMKLRGRLSIKGLHKNKENENEVFEKLKPHRSLKKLFVEGMPKVVTIAPELFPSLEVLELENMHVDCSKLDDVLIGKISSLWVILRMERSFEAVLTSIIGASSSIISLKIDNISGLTPLHGEVLQHMEVVKHLCITKCHIVEYLWELKFEARKYLANLKKLEATYYKKLASLGKTTYNIRIATVNLTEVSLTNCEMLQSYKCPQSIKKLVIHNCQSIEELLFLQGQNPLLILDIQRCHSLKIISCRNMKSFPHTLLPTLASLKVLLITNCPLMVSFLCCSWPPKNRTLKKAYVRMGTSEFLNTLVNWIQALDDKGEYIQMLSQDGIYVITTPDYQFGKTFETHYNNQPQIRYEQISSELKKLEKISSLIEDLLKDAEINENTVGEAFKLWLHSFEELVYETDSLLSDVGEKAMRRQLIEESYASITSKKKKTGVDNLRNHLDDLGGLPHKRRPKTPDVIRKMVISPDVDETIIMSQKHNKEPKFFNDEKVKDHFEFKAWVPVYDKFDAIQISNAIFQCVSGEFKEFSNHDMIQEGAIADNILGKMTSLSLLAIDALGEQNFDSHLTFWLLAKRICEKCQGFPLALESVRKLPKTKTGVKDWEMSLAGQYFYSLDDENGNNQSLEMLRHFSFVSQQFGTYSKFKALEVVPNSVGSLKHMCDTLMLNKLPSGIGGMTSLQFLSKVIIEGSNRHKISKLKGMMELRGRLSNEGLHKLTQLTLRGYQNCECLPKLGCLGSLKKLFVEGMPKVVIIAPELFPSLEVLELEDMHVDCSKLDDVLIGKMSSLRVILRMERCSEAVLTSIIGASSSIISLEMDNISGLTPLHGEVLQHLG
ncbi:disease resistance protein [Tanacetum coccineum]